MKRNLLFTCAIGAMLTTTAQPGSMDPTFADNAVVKNINFLELADEVSSNTAIDSEDRIWIAGHTVIDGDGRLIVVRLTPDGNYDTTFGTDGHVIVNVASNNVEYVRGLAFQDNNLLIAGEKTSEGITNQFVLRMTPQGFLDPVFASAGIADLPFNASVSDMVVDATGHIYLAGAVDGSVCATKLLPNGSPDPSFSFDGFREIAFASTDASSAIAVDSEGVVWIFGYGSNNGTIRAHITSFLPNGNNNANFAFTARKSFEWINDKDFLVLDGMLTADGSRFYLAGFTADAGALDAAMIAVDTSGDLVESFGNAGRFEFNATLGGDEAFTNIAEGNDGVYADIQLEEFPAGTNSGLAYVAHTGNLIGEFGNGGWMTYNIAEAGADQPTDMGFQSDGNIILVGNVDGGEVGTFGYALRIFTAAETSSATNLKREKAGVFPNPAKEMITLVMTELSGQGETYRIYNATGQLVASGILYNQQQSIQIGSLAAGTYQVLIGERAYTRFVKTY